MKLDVLNDKLSIDPQSVIKKNWPPFRYTNLYSESNKTFFKVLRKIHAYLNILF